MNLEDVMAGKMYDAITSVFASRRGACPHTPVSRRERTHTLLCLSVLFKLDHVQRLSQRTQLPVGVTKMTVVRVCRCVSVVEMLNNSNAEVEGNSKAPLTTADRLTHVEGVCVLLGT